MTAARTRAAFAPGDIGHCVNPECGRRIAGATTARQEGIATHARDGLCTACDLHARRTADRGATGTPRAHERRRVAGDLSWQARAACLGTDPETFFPLSEGDTIATRHAKAICSRCPVRDECLEFALHSLRFGIAGGLTSEERRRIRRDQLQEASA